MTDWADMLAAAAFQVDGDSEMVVEYRGTLIDLSRTEARPSDAALVLERAQALIDER